MPLLHATIDEAHRAQTERPRLVMAATKALVARTMSLTGG